MTISYDDNGSGSIATKTDALNQTQNYDYGVPGTEPVHAVKNISPLNETYKPLQKIEYTAFNKISQIKEGDMNGTTQDFDVSGNITQLDYKYGLDNERRKMTEIKTVAGSVFSTRTKYYSSNYEKEEISSQGVTTSREINYIFAPDGLAAIYEKKNGTGKYYYIATDALGSINMIVNANDGTITSDMSYDAWGRRRNPYDWSYNNITTSNITDRGFTMHEMLDNFDLINMNGRAYDPLLGQFLSPDPFVSHPENPQGYNRYAYCLNNPLKYTDPSGYMNWKVWTNRNRKFDEAWDRMLVLNYESGFNTEYSRQLEQRVSGYKTMKEWEYKKYIMKQTASGRFKSGNVPMYGGQSTNSPNGNNNSGFGPGDGWLPGIWISGPVKNEKGPDWINDPSLKYTENYQSNGWDFCSSNLISFITGIGLKEIHYSTTSYASQELAKSKDLRIMFTNYMLGKTPAANYWFSPTITDPETYLPSLRAHFNALRTSIVCLFVGTMEIKDVKKFDDQTFLLTIKNDLGFSTLGYHLASKDKDWGNGRYFEPPLSKVTQIYHILYHYKP